MPVFPGSIPSIGRLVSAIPGLLGALAFIHFATVASAGTEKPFHRGELLFPPENWHNHGSCIVETPRGDLLVCWFHGSGERKSDDVRIEGARLRRGSRAWSERFVMADTPEFPDTNCAMFIDPEGRLWLLWPTIQANLWESALMKYRISSDFHRAGPPRWASTDVLHVKPGPEFDAEVTRCLPRLEAAARNAGWSPAAQAEVKAYLDAMQQHTTNKFYRRVGWMTRAHPFVLEGRRLIVPLYHDGFSFSLMAITDDWGQTWHTSRPLIGGGNIQPSIARRRDGSLYTVMRDNGPPPKRLLQATSRDRGESWGDVTDSDLPNPGSGAEIIGLRDGHWALINNDTEKGRHSLVVQISDDEGRTWKWKRHLEYSDPGVETASYHYPSLIEARDGSLHASYSHFIDRRPGAQPGKSIKHAHFNRAWVNEGDPAVTVR